MARRSRKAEGVPTIEWITGLVGLGIVVGTLGFIAYEAFQGGSGSPVLTVVVERTERTGAGFSAHVIVRNQSRTAAAEVVVDGVIRAAGKEHRGQARLDYVAGLSTRKATLLFPAPPERGEIAVRVVGFTTP
jgi:uncharacterized protein (TIGR02588 family)